MKVFGRISYFILLVLCLSAEAWAGDSISLAQPEDSQAFDAAVAKKLGKSNQSQIGAQPTQVTAAPVQGGVAPSGSQQVGSVSGAREKLIKAAIRALQNQDSPGFLSLVTPASQAELGGAEAFTRLQSTVAGLQNFKWIDETVERSISGPGKQNDGSPKPILQLFSGAVQATDTSGQSVKAFKVQILCGSKIQDQSDSAAVSGEEAGKCLIQELRTD